MRPRSSARAPQVSAPLVLAALALGASAPAAQLPLEDQLLVPAESGYFDSFGGAIDIDGERMIVGGRGVSGPLLGGAFDPLPQAWIFERQAGGAWALAATLDPPGPYSQPVVFRDVAIDGDDAFVKREGSFNDLHVYRRDGSGAWNLVQTVPAVGSDWGDSLEADNGALMVGVPGGGFAGWNRVEVYERAPSGEYLLQHTVPTPTSGPSFYQAFGEQLDLDGTRAIATGRLGTFSVPNLFELELVGGAWQLVGPIVVPGGLVGRVALDGDRIANALDLSVQILARQPDGTWALEVEIDVDLANAVNDDFGRSVDLFGDWLAVGAPSMRKDGGDSLFDPMVGGTYLFRRAASGEWGLVTRVAASDTAVASGTGVGVALGDDLVAVGGSSVTSTGSVAVTGLGEFFHGERVISAAAGGTQELFLFAGESLAGQSHLILGSASGTTPPIPVPGTSLLLPLALDAYTVICLKGGAPYSPALGPLDGNGSASSTLALPAGLSPSAVGLTLHHAFLTLDAPASFTSVSNTVSLDIVP